MADLDQGPLRRLLDDAGGRTRRDAAASRRPGAAGRGDHARAAHRAGRAGARPRPRPRAAAAAPLRGRGRGPALPGAGPARRPRGGPARDRAAGRPRPARTCRQTRSCNCWSTRTPRAATTSARRAAISRAQAAGPERATTAAARARRAGVPPPRRVVRLDAGVAAGARARRRRRARRPRPRCRARWRGDLGERHRHPARRPTSPSCRPVVPRSSRRPRVHLPVQRATGSAARCRWGRRLAGARPRPGRLRPQARPALAQPATALRRRGEPRSGDLDAGHVADERLRDRPPQSDGFHPGPRRIGRGA